MEQLQIGRALDMDEIHVKVLEGHRGPISSLCASSHTIVSGGWDSTIKVWDLYSGRLLRSLSGHKNIVANVGFDEEANAIASISEDLTMKIWNLTTGECLHSLRAHDKLYFMGMVGDVIVTSSSDRTLKAFSARTGQCLHVFRGHTRGVWCRYFSGDMLASGSFDKTIKVCRTVCSFMLC